MGPITTALERIALSGAVTRIRLRQDLWLNLLRERALHGFMPMFAGSHERITVAGVIVEPRLFTLSTAPLPAMTLQRLARRLAQGMGQ